MYSTLNFGACANKTVKVYILEFYPILRVNTIDNKLEKSYDFEIKRKDEAIESILVFLSAPHKGIKGHDYKFIKSQVDALIEFHTA